MSPLDDELRRTLSERASVLTPSSDPLAGIRSRASRIRRRRTLAAVTGAALAVALVAVAVPLLSDARPGATPDRFATPSASPLPDPTTWEYRGNDIPPSTLDAFRREFEARHPESSFVPLFGQVYEPSRTQELVFASRGPDANGGWRAGVVQSSASGTTFLYDEGRSALAALAFVLPGDETARLLVVAAPDSTDISASNDALHEPYTPLTVLAPGVATGPVSASRPALRVRLRIADGRIGDVEPSDNLWQPANVLSWPSRGDASVGPSVHDLKVAFTRDRNRTDGAEVLYRALFTADTDSGVRYTVGQAWFAGDRIAETVSYATGGTRGPVLRRYGITPDSTPVIAALIRDLPGTSVDHLVVVPQPNTGQVSYDTDATGAFRPVMGQDHLDGVVVIDRAKDETDDRLEVLDGHGDTDNPTYRGPVATLLTGRPAS